MGTLLFHILGVALCRANLKLFICQTLYNTSLVYAGEIKINGGISSAVRTDKTFIKSSEVFSRID